MRVQKSRPKKMRFKFITTTDPYYPDELMLRWEVLRKPLGMPPGSEVLTEELECIHLIAIENTKIVGCILFHPETADAGRLLQLALSEEFRGRGFGRKLMSNLEQFLAKKGIYNLYLHAREEIQGFYARMGYQMEGEPVESMGFSHRVMKKTLLIAAA